MSTNTMELNMNEMEQASGGTFDDNKYKDSEYEAVGISIVSHWIAPNEFWWKGKNIGHTKANAVVLFCQFNGQQPASAEEAIDFTNKLREESRHGCNLLRI